MILSYSALVATQIDGKRLSFIEPWESNGDEVILADNNQSKIIKTSEALGQAKVGGGRKSGSHHAGFIYKSRSCPLHLLTMEVHGKHNKAG